MPSELQYNQHYKDWLKEINERIQLASLKAAMATNAEFDLAIECIYRSRLFQSDEERFAYLFEQY